MASQITLYQWPGHAGLPSVTAACLTVEAYLRLSGVDFCIQTCSSSNTPSGVIPAVEKDSDIIAPSEPNDLAAARAILAQLAASGLNLDAHLSAAQVADALAFKHYIQATLEPATQYTTWVESRGFKEFRKVAYGAALPFPLSYIVPWSQQRDMVKQLGNIDGFKAYPAAADALSALADRLRASGGPFFFGPKPSSVDALLFGHLAFYKHSPIAAPTLQTKVRQLGVLSDYVTRIMSEWFSKEVPPPPEEDPSSWSEAAQGQRAKPRHVPTVEEVRMWKGSQYWLAGAAAAVGAYVLLSGQYVQIVTVDDEDADAVIMEDDGGDDE